MTKKVEQKPQTLSQRDKLDRKLSELATKALSLEERAEYAEKEAQLWKRVRVAQDRIRATRPPGILGELAGSVVPNLGVIWGRIPAPFKLLLIAGTLVVVLLLVGKSCTGSG